MPRRGYRKGISDRNVPLTRQVYLRVTADVLVSLKQDAASRRLTISKLAREILTAYATAQSVRLPQVKGPSAEALRELTRMRIPVIATGCSGASRPSVPIDRDQLEGGGFSAAG